MRDMPRLVSLAVLTFLIVVLGIAFFRVVAPFLLPLFLAGMTAIICQPLFRYFLDRTGQRLSLAAAGTTFSILAAVLVPLITGILIASLQLYAFATTELDSHDWQQRSHAVMDSLVDAVVEVRTWFMSAEEDLGGEPAPEGIEQPEGMTPVEGEPGNASDPPDASDLAPDPEETTSEEDGATPLAPREDAQEIDAEERAEIAEQTADDVRPDADKMAEDARTWLRTSLKDIGDKSLGRAAGTTFGVLAGTFGLLITFIIGLMMYCVALFYFLADGTALIRGTEALIPVHAGYQRQLLEQFARVVRSVVLATFFAAVAQGFATAAALWVFGFSHIFLLFVVATLAAMIPLAGTWLVWCPCAISLFVSGHPYQAVMLTLYGMLFVGFLDNVIRTYVLNSDTKLHPLLAFISVLGGIQAMGLWGVFLGPIVASCLHALVDIFNQELQEFSQERAPNEDLVVADAPRPAPAAASPPSESSTSQDSGTTTSAAKSAASSSTAAAPQSSNTPSNRSSKRQRSNRNPRMRR